MRSLSFGTEQVDKDRFDILYGGACVSERGIMRTELNTFNRIMAKFEEVAKPIDGMPEKAPVKFELGDTGGTIILEEPEYKLLNDLHDVIRWGKIKAKEAEDTYKWLAAIPRTSLKKVGNNIEEVEEHVPG